MTSDFYIPYLDQFRFERGHSESEASLSLNLPSWSGTTLFESPLEGHLEL